MRRWLPKESSHILDVGGGGCELAQQLALLGHRVVAVDLSADNLRLGRSPYVEAVEVVAGDATRLPFGDASFDAVVCNSALEHFPDDETAIAEMARVTRFGGTVLITTDSFPARTSIALKSIPRSWRRRELQESDNLLSAMQDHHRKKHAVVNYYLAEQIVSKFERHGWRAREWRYYLNGAGSKLIYELHIVLRWLDFYNKLSRRLYPLFCPFTLVGRRRPRGYGLALKAVRDAD